MICLKTFKNVQNYINVIVNVNIENVEFSSFQKHNFSI